MDETRTADTPQDIPAQPDTEQPTPTLEEAMAAAAHWHQVARLAARIVKARAVHAKHCPARKTDNLFRPFGPCSCGLDAAVSDLSRMNLL